MSLQLGKCIFHRWLMPPEGKIGTRIRFQTSMPGRYNDQIEAYVRTFEATLRNISTQSQLDEGDPRYGFILDETPDSADIFRAFRDEHQQECQKVLEEWASEPTILPSIQEHLSEPPVFHLRTSAEFIFAEGDRVSVHVPSPSISSISEPLGNIIELEIID